MASRSITENVNAIGSLAIAKFLTKSGIQLSRTAVNERKQVPQCERNRHALVTRLRNLVGKSSARVGSMAPCQSVQGLFRSRASVSCGPFFAVGRNVRALSHFPQLPQSTLR